MSLIYCSAVFLWTGDVRTAEELIERAIACAERHSLAPYRAFGVGLKGELSVARGEPEVGLRLLRDTLENLHAEQHNILFTVFASALAEGLRKVGRSEEALSTINAAIAHATNSGTVWQMAELLRFKAQILAYRPRHDQASAIKYLIKALEVAREQSALAFELRSAIDLARLLAESGQRDQARQVLALVYDRFTEGFETSDLRIARQVLEDLA
jgi:predicted ATPase